MKNDLLTAMCMATMLGLGAAISAQTGTPPKDQMDKTAMKDGQITVSGCVAAGKDAGQFMLNHATVTGGMGHGMMDKSKMDKDQMAKPGMSGGQMSYELVGGASLKAHMTHKVEVTGTMSKMDMDHMAKMDKMDSKDTMPSSMKPMKLNVTAVKMISATCP